MGEIPCCIFHLMQDFHTFYHDSRITADMLIRPRIAHFCAVHNYILQPTETGSDDRSSSSVQPIAHDTPVKFRDSRLNVLDKFHSKCWRRHFRPK